MHQSSGPRQHIEALPVELLHSPLEYIQADHLRQRVLCSLCEEIASAKRPKATVLAEVIDFMSTDLLVHIVDEEHDFYPLLRRRSEPGDELEEVLGQLAGEHASDERRAKEIVAGLTAVVDKSGRDVPASLREALRTFADNERHHLALENAAVMPLAKVRLTSKDLKDLSGRMAARRGIALSAAG